MTTNFQGFLGGIDLGPGGYFWFVSPGANPQLEYITNQGAITLVQTRFGPYLIGSGSRARVWFASSSQIGRVNDDLSISYFMVPAGHTVLSVGPALGGYEWFSLDHLETAKVSDAGVVTIYQPFSGKRGGFPPMSAGPDGNIWFVVHRSIFKMTTDGALTRYLLPKQCSGFGLVAGGDGNLWMSGYCSITPEVYRVTTSGNIKLFTVPVSMGTLIMSYGSQYIVGETLPHDILTFNIGTHAESPPIPFPTHSQNGEASVGGMTLDPFGDIWFTSYYGDDPGAAEIVVSHR